MDLGSVMSYVSERIPGKKDGPDVYLAVKISSMSVLAAAWQIEDGKVVISEVGSADVAGEGWDSLLSAADQAVSLALKDETIIQAKAVFAVPSDWVSSGKLVPEHLQTLRHLCKELDLSPQGFVVVSEALENFYKETEGAPLTAMLIGSDGPKGFLTMYRAGQNLGTTQLDLLADDISPAVEKALRNFTQTEVLPSRIILYDGKSDLDTVAEKLVAHPWTKQLPFLHFPKVEIAPAELVIKAVAVAGGVQLGGKFDLSVPERETVVSLSELEEVSAEEAGFISEELGPITFEGTVSKPSGEKPSLGQIQEIPTTNQTPPPVKSQAMLGFDIAAVWKTAVGIILPKVQANLKLPNKPQNSTVIFAAVAVVLVFLGALIYFAPKTTVIIRIVPKPFDKEMEVVVVTDSSSAVSSSSAVLVGNFINVSEIGTKKGVASGKKLVGDKARGSVTIYSTSGSKSFTAGAVLASPDNLKLTLDHDATVASGDAITPATISTAVTAADIGDSYNLPSGTKFTIAGLPSSQYLAKNDAALTGGSSHQATVVAKDDQDRLMATLSAELTEKAKSDLAAKVPPGQNLLPNAMTTTISQKRFSRDVEAEADTVSLDLTIDYRGVVFSQSDLTALFTQKFVADIASGFVLAPESSKIEVKSAKNNKDGNSVLSVRLTASLLPAIDKRELISKISGKNVAGATAIINTLPAVLQISFETQPRFLTPVTKFFLPWKKENIKIEIVSE